MNKTTVYLPAELQRGVSEVARRTGRRQAEIIRTAIEQFLRAQERPVPRSVGAGEDTGLSAAESEDWLRDRWDQR
jgi:predicted transcriptional regulator